jgi:acyl-coenzyme A synthetase/AMP-(fatty) acid ligase
MCLQEEFPASGGDFRAGAGNGRIHFVKEIPKTPAGKIVKAELRRRYT